VWLVYPIILALGEGTGCLNPNGEAIAYTVLDIFAKTVFGIWLLYVHKHEDDEVHCARFPESWCEPRGKRTGLIRLPVSLGMPHILAEVGFADYLTGS